jgi:predicted RNA-binding Zn-ribbon protein involved in translation (DUF1610 family)
MEKQTYNLDVFCSNCDFQQNISIPMGTKVEDHACPNCGNKTLTKHYKQIGLEPRFDSYE